MITWEQTTLPSPSSLTVKHRTSTQRKRTESGRFQIRKRYSTDYEQANLSFQFFGNQFQLFKGIFVYQLNNGADWFYINLPVGGDQQLVQCKVRFISDYSYTYTNVDNAIVRLTVEFFRVEQPSELTLDNLTTISTPTPYQDQNLHLWYAQAETPDVTDASFLLETVNTSAYAVQWWDGSITTQATNTSAVKAIPTGAVIGQEHKVLAWSCTSLTDTTPSGSIKNITAENNLLKRINTKELFEIQNITCANVDNLNGEFDNEIATFPIKQITQDYYFSNSEKIESFVLDAFGESAEMKSFTAINFTKLESFSVTTPNNVDVTFNSINLQSCSLSGTLNLSNVIFDKPFVSGARYIKASNNNLIQVRINKLVQNNASYDALDFNNNQLINVVVEDELVVLGGNAVSTLRTNNLNVTAVYNLIDKMTVSTSGLHLIRLWNNPCWINDELDPNDPDTTATLALAASKNISLEG